MRVALFVVACVVSYFFGVFTDVATIEKLIATVDFSSQSVANVAAILASLGTFLAVIVALKQSREAKQEAELNRRNAVEQTKEKVFIYNSIFVSPPNMNDLSLGLITVNKGAVPAYVQSISCGTSPKSTSILVTNQHLVKGTQTLPIYLLPGSSTQFMLSVEFLMLIARYAVQFCNGRVDDVKFLVSTNLEVFESDLNREVKSKVEILIKKFKCEIEKDILKSTQAQIEYERNRDNDEWLLHFEKYNK